MVFASPLWLIGLLPWAGLAAYLLPGRGTVAVVPFVVLWRGSVAPAELLARRLPEIPILFMLIALLLAVLAAANPMVRSEVAVSGDVTIILDRGATMAEPGQSGEPFRGVVRECADRFPIAEDARVILVPVPGQQIEVTGGQWVATANRLPATAIRVDLDQIIARQWSQTSGPIIVLSNQKFHSDDPRIVQILPEPAVDGVAITAFSARASPHPEAMVRVRNRSDLKSVHLSIASGPERVDRDVPLPTRGQSVVSFVDLKSLGPTVSATIMPHTKADPWAAAFLAQESSGVQLVVDPALDDAVKRMAAVYRRNRPSGSKPQSAIVTHRELPADQPGVWIAAGAHGSGLADVSVLVPSAVTRNVVNWPAIGNAKMPEGFAAVVSTKEGPIVAVRETPSRQVWVNAGLSDWEKTSDFVVFFGNVFDWISSGDQEYRSIATEELGEGWTPVSGGAMPSGIRAGEWPGIYRGETAQTVAINAGEYPSGDVATATSSRHAFASTGKGELRLKTPVIFTALGSLLIGLLWWQRSDSSKPES